MTSADILRMAEALKTKVVIPVHYDIWSNFMADPKEITLLWQSKKRASGLSISPLYLASWWKVYVSTRF